MSDGETKAIYGPIDDDLEAEIERLRAALREVFSLSDNLDCPGPDGYYLEQLQKIAKEALGDGRD